MYEQQFWDVIEAAWEGVGDLRERIRRHDPIELAALTNVIFALGDTLATLSEQDGITFIAAWRSRAYGLCTPSRVPDIEVACFVVALGREAYEEALQAGWQDAEDPSEGAFAAMLASFDEEASSVSPMARQSSPPSARGADTPAPSAIRSRPPPQEE